MTLGSCCSGGGKCWPTPSGEARSVRRWDWKAKRKCLRGTEPFGGASASTCNGKRQTNTLLGAAPVERFPPLKHGRARILLSPGSRDEHKKQRDTPKSLPSVRRIHLNSACNSFAGSTLEP